MATKKGSSTKRGAATPRTVDGEVKTPFTLSLTVPEHLLSRGAVREFEIESWLRYGEYFARVLEHPNGTATFRKAFAAVFIDRLFDPSGIHDDITEPYMLRLLYPLAMIAMMSEDPSGGHSTAATLLTLLETLVPFGVREPIRAELFDEKGGAKK